ncbi:Fis family transcriptional regulator [Methylobacterium sp. DM1]|nr:Fis family transcriptional regulator [Methylobacterium sp. DM1]
MGSEETQRLRAVALASLNYEAETGILRWKIARAHRLRVGDIAGSRCKIHGYIKVHLEHRGFFAHRLIWLMLHGDWPEHVIDHINGRRDDNRLSNLRCATRQQNAMNGRRRKRSGLKGAFWLPRQKVWHARICRQYLGSFDTEQEAHAAYMSAARAQFGEFARAG